MNPIPWVVTLSIVAYVLVCWKRVTIPCRWRWIIESLVPVYNALQIWINLSVLIWGYQVWTQPDQHLQCKIEITHDLFVGWWWLNCRPTSWILPNLLVVHMCNKFMDWLDTLIILARQDWRRLSFLHVSHHAGVSLIWFYLVWIGLHQEAATIAVGAIINSAIHVIMYTYYSLTSFAWARHRCVKMTITLLQMTQFIVCGMHAIHVLWYEKQSPRAHQNAWIQLLFMIQQWVTFAHFFKTTYCHRRKMS